jgi:oxygen-independent coproporphyrinogen-3 oxidase
MTINSAYVHIPFCRRRCFYCDFPITAIGDSPRSTGSPLIGEYVDFLCQEISITKNLTNTSLETVFFGGGTPSLLPIDKLATVLDCLANKFSLSENAEISIEIDPGTFTLSQLQGYLKLGINRFSLGVQSLQENLLQVCGRSHSLQDTFTAIQLIKEAGINNFNIDLISGLPNQSLEDWEYSLKTAISFQPKHFSCYDLVLEPVTVFGKKYQPGKAPLPSDEITANMYRLADQILQKAGYIHYEISNYAREGYECKHNRVYWENKSYYGFGMGAASYTEDVRFTRPRSRKEYYDYIESLIRDPDRTKLDPLTEKDILLETLMLGLRLKEGVNLITIRDRFGTEIVKQILDCVQPFVKKNWVNVSANQDYFNLTIPEGFLYSNVVLSDLFNINIP